MVADLPEGTVFAGRYRIVRRIAAGAMGAVYEAVHVETNRRRALKVMHPHLFQSDDMRARFKREARIAAEIESEHIVDVSDAGVDETTGTPFLVMEFLRGEELGERLKRMGRLPPAEVLSYLHQVAAALDRTHAASIVHRDLKPANLFLTHRDDGSPRIKILDFGVAKLVAENATGAAATQSLGTPLYVAPEQFMPEAKLTGAADIYALGMMAYTLLVGVPYWKREAAAGLMPFVVVAVRGPQEPPVQRAASWGVPLPPAFDAWFARATAPDPAARFRTATEAVRALDGPLQPAPAFRASSPHFGGMPPAAPFPVQAFVPPDRPGIDPVRASSPHFAPMPAGAHRAMPAGAHRARWRCRKRADRSAALSRHCRQNQAAHRSLHRRPSWLPPSSVQGSGFSYCDRPAKPSRRRMPRPYLKRRLTWRPARPSRPLPPRPLPSPLPRHPWPRRPEPLPRLRLPRSRPHPAPKQVQVRLPALQRMRQPRVLRAPEPACASSRHPSPPRQPKRPTLIPCSAGSE